MGICDAKNDRTNGYILACICICAFPALPTFYLCCADPCLPAIFSCALLIVDKVIDSQQKSKELKSHKPK